MTAGALLADLSARGIIVTVAGDSIELDAPAGVLTDDDVAVLRKSKPDVLNSLRSRCRPHNDPDNYIDVPDDRRPGWVRSTCKLCGCFVGYRDTTRYTGNATARLIPENRTSSSGPPLLSILLMNVE